MDSDAVGTVVPRLVASPQNTDDVAELIVVARQERLRLLCVGGRTSLALGAPAPFDVSLSTVGLDATVEPRGEDMVVTVDAGVRIARLAEALAQIGERIAWDPDRGEIATVGGVLAANRSGGLAYAFGQPRDLVLGMTVVDGRGRILQVGGRVVKNVAGYDLARLFAGSRGTLGVITQATLRTHPVAEFARTLRARFLDSREADAARAALFASSLPLAALDLELEQTPTTAWVLCIRIEGSARSVEVQQDRVARICRQALACDTAPWRSPFHCEPDANVVMRLETSPAQAIALASLLHTRFGAVLSIAAHLGSGSLRASAAVSDTAAGQWLLRNFEAIADDRGAALSCERLYPGLEQPAPVDTPAIARLSRTIKERFDPDRVFPALALRPEARA
jgi:glycolate oxidase FAD binding subunit